MFGATLIVLAVKAQGAKETCLRPTAISDLLGVQECRESWGTWPGRRSERDKISLSIFNKHPASLLIPQPNWQPEAKGSDPRGHCQPLGSGKTSEEATSVQRTVVGFSGHANVGLTLSPAAVQLGDPEAFAGLSP